MERKFTITWSKKLKRLTIDTAVDRGEAGVTPPKKGRPLKYPKELMENLAKHAIMMQLSGEGEASCLKMLATVVALTFGTPFDGISPDYV